MDFKNNVITINKQRQYIHGVGIITKTPKTEGSVRKVTTSGTVIGLLKAYKIKQTENRLKLGSAWTETNLIFTHENGIPMHPHRPYKFFVTFLKKHNLPKISFHALRHTNTSLLISEGTDIVTVSDRLGPANKNITLNIYSHMIASKETQAAIKMDEFYEKIMQ